MQNTNTKDACIQEFKDIQAKLDKPVTRDLFRKTSKIATRDWEYRFGTFSEFKRQALGEPTKADKKVVNKIAKVESLSARIDLGKERLAYAENYVRSDSARYKTMLVGSDFHDKEIDPFFLRVFLDTAKRVSPENIVLGGDIFDLPEFGRYTIDPREWDAVGRIKFTHDNIFAPLRAAAPDAQIDLIEGNHECVSEDTELLTSIGWLRAGAYHALKAKPAIASFDLNDHKLTFNPPIAVAAQDNRKIVQIETSFKKERITENHSIIYDGVKTKLEGIDKLSGRKMLNAIKWSRNDLADAAVDPNIVKFAMWLIMRGMINKTEGEFKYWVSFHHLSARLQRRVKGVVQKIKGVKWIKTSHGLEVEGPSIAALLELITGKNDIASGTRWFEMPDWFENLPTNYGAIIAEELIWGSSKLMPSNNSYFKGWNQTLGEDLQWFLITRGIPCNLRTLSINEYLLTFNETRRLERWRGDKVRKSTIAESGRVISVQTVNGTLITKLDGKINFTGNCRLVKHLADFSPATRAILGDLHGMSIGDLFALGKFKINYIAKADLRAYSEKEHKRELVNNYKIYHNNVLVHHFPHARNLGMPGVNGHHHAHVVWPMYNVHQGAYEWHQLGAGHKRSASYCEGEKWHNGFALIHIDTLTKSVNIEYIPVTNMAIVGGKFYHRETAELI